MLFAFFILCHWTRISNLRNWLLIKWIKSASFQWILFPLIVVAKEKDEKNAIWKERCKIIYTQKSSVMWMRENIWENNGVLAGLGEKLEKTSPQPHFSPLRKASPQPYFQGRPSPWKMLVHLKRPPDANRCLLSPWRCHLCCLPSNQMTTLVASWHQGIWDAMNCNVLSCFLKWAWSQMPEESLARCVSSRWTSGCPGATWGGVTGLSSHAG